MNLLSKIDALISQIECNKKDINSSRNNHTKEVFNEEKCKDFPLSLNSLITHNPVWIANKTILYDTQIINKQHLSGNTVPIILLPGFGVSLEQWHPFLNFLLHDPQYKDKFLKQAFILISIKGYGKSQVYPTYNHNLKEECHNTWHKSVIINEIMQVINQIVGNKDENHFAIGGQSYGAILAQYIAIEYPKRVEKLFLTGIVGYYTNEFVNYWNGNYCRESVIKSRLGHRSFLQTKLWSKAFEMEKDNFENGEVDYLWTMLMNSNMEMWDHSVFTCDIDLRRNDYDDLKLLKKYQNTLKILIIQGEYDKVENLQPYLKIFKHQESGDEQLKLVKIKHGGHFIVSQRKFFQQIGNYFMAFFT